MRLARTFPGPTTDMMSMKALVNGMQNACACMCCVALDCANLRRILTHRNSHLLPSFSSKVIPPWNVRSQQTTTTRSISTCIVQVATVVVLQRMLLCLMVSDGPSNTKSCLSIMYSSTSIL